MKRTLVSVLLIGIMISCSINASATNFETFRASPTLSSYNAGLYSGAGKGEAIVGFDVAASRWGDSIGVERIRFYTEDGDLVASVTGTTANGLVCSNTGYHGGDYDYSGLPSGDYYYAKVTVFAEYNGVYDSRTVTTNTVWVR